MLTIQLCNAAKRSDWLLQVYGTWDILGGTSHLGLHRKTVKGRMLYSWSKLALVMRTERVSSKHKSLKEKSGLLPTEFDVTKPACGPWSSVHSICVALPVVLHGLHDDRKVAWATTRDPSLCYSTVLHCLQLLCRFFRFRWASPSQI